MHVDSDFFKKINGQQYLWYNSQLAIDEEENFELLREMAEHNAMFTNPEGVNKVRESRKNTYSIPTEKFEGLVEDLFGRPIPKKGEADNSSPLDPYLNMELDEIKFIPIRGDNG